MIVNAEQTPVSGQDGLHTLHLSVAGGLRQFGANIDTLSPGAWSSRRHWHSAEDEFLYVLSGTATLRDDSGLTDLFPGDAVAFRHGDPNGHHFTNCGDSPCRWLIVGSRAHGDICTYPDDDCRQINGDTRWQVITTGGEVLREGDLPVEVRGLPPAWGKTFDGTPKPRILRMGAMPPDPAVGSYPAQWNDLGRAEDIALSDAGGLTQFGAYLAVLHPGAQSSLRHWHEAEDEFLYVLEGHPTLIESDGPHMLAPGDCVCWPANVPNGHCLRNDGASRTVLFTVGTRLREDVVHYPDHDLHYIRRGGLRWQLHKDGTPWPGWPKETNR